MREFLPAFLRRLFGACDDGPAEKVAMQSPQDDPRVARAFRDISAASHGLANRAAVLHTLVRHPSEKNADLALASLERHESLQAVKNLLEKMDKRAPT